MFNYAPSQSCRPTVTMYGQPFEGQSYRLHRQIHASCCHFDISPADQREQPREGAGAQAGGEAPESPRAAPRTPERVLSALVTRDRPVRPPMVATAGEEGPKESPRAVVRI
ncbi:hypothetical protein GCM10018980_64230 [Streptomyces capoamus]|uniref:Uncharacterized protein n=1 Tax=Streptomyces capoamus TaxID=68183 RepID=A0A919F129_9ACTN|nr:hypothetical protein GCM10010501_00250 [Streptomyces libani subsp. rufus]GHG69923.1 hypothetical protein GCM10018980_64230 [Streptomyces capoamus]